MTAQQRARLRAISAQLLLGIAGLALITFVCFWIGFGVARTGFAYVILIALVSLLGSFSASILSIDPRRRLSAILLRPAIVRLPG